jgi:cytoplasmic iron level regulating protein YaaA (DUF328/UPF0246 family)
MHKKSYTIIPTIPMFNERAHELAAFIKEYDVKGMQKAFRCSDKIAHEVFAMYNNFGKVTHPALFLYDGIQYKNIDVSTLQKKEIAFLNENLLIADSLYGLLKPTDLISPYRLDFNTKFSFVNTDFYQEQLKNLLISPVVNLCSKEFSVLLPPEKTITIHFLQKIKGITKSYSTYTKMERGRFVRYLAKKGDTSLATLISYSNNGYTLDNKKSTEHNIIYTALDF